MNPPPPTSFILIMKITLYIILICCLCGCTLNTGAPIYSKDIKESKTTKAYIQEYNFPTGTIKHNNVELEIKEIWLEYHWIYENLFKKIRVGDKKRLVVSVTYKNEDDYWNETSPFEVGKNGITSLGSSNRGTYKYLIKMNNYADEILLNFWDKEVFLIKK